MVLADSHRIPLTPWYSGYPTRLSRFRLQDYHLLWLTFPGHSTILRGRYMGPTTPANISALVWAVPVSLAATQGITIVFSSSGYLDVSVPRVSFPINRDDWT